MQHAGAGWPSLRDTSRPPHCTLPGVYGRAGKHPSGEAVATSSTTSTTQISHVHAEHEAPVALGDRSNWYGEYAENEDSDHQSDYGLHGQGEQ